MILQLIIVVVDYTFESSFSNHVPHLEGEEGFRSTNDLLIILLVRTMILIDLTM